MNYYSIWSFVKTRTENLDSICNKVGPSNSIVYSLFKFSTRFWFSEPKQSWLYMCPNSAKLSEDFGYWICFHLQDLPEEGGDGKHWHIRSELF